MDICLIGNANCGKTTLFNGLTGLRQKTGNFLGVTVEKKVGKCKYNKRYNVIDLPGLYSINQAVSKDEKEVINYLKETPPQVIINVIDATNLERNLFLTVELCKLNIPVILALNFCDDLKKENCKIDLEKLSNVLGVFALRVSAINKAEIKNLVNNIEKAKVPKNERYKNVKKESEIYGFVSSFINKVINKKCTEKLALTNKWDNLFLGKYLGIPLFILIISGVYFLSLKCGGIFSKLIESGIEKLTTWVKISIAGSGENSGIKARIISSLIGDGILKGVGTVLAFIPQVLILFSLLCVLEESGYLARVSYLFDFLFCKIGLSGKSVIPVCIGSGCSVPAIMSTRVIQSSLERERTVSIIPFVPCSAKMAVFGWFSYKYFNGNPFIATAMYLGGIFFAFFYSLIVNGKTENKNFVLELPLLRVPRFSDVLIAVTEKLKEFLFKAGTTIFIVSVIVWALKNFGFTGYVGDNVEGSFIYVLGNVFKYVFYPLGFGSWKATVSVIFSIFAKESVVESLEMLSVSGEEIFANTVSVISFMVFILISPPCISALTCQKQALKGTKFFKNFLLQTFFAYLICLAINSVNNLNSFVLLFIILFVIIIVLSVRRTLGGKNRNFIRFNETSGLKRRRRNNTRRIRTS